MPVGQSTPPSIAARAMAAHRAQRPDAPPASLGLVLLGMAALAVVSAMFLLPWAAFLGWAGEEQRTFQHAMADALRALRQGDSGALLALCSATAAYGFVHALGPGHGKVILGGAAFATGASLRRMVLLTLASSLAQSTTAILLVLGVGYGLGWATRDLVGLTEDWLTLASSVAIAAIGGVLMLRGVRAWRRSRLHGTGADPTGCSCGHAHGPTADQVEGLQSVRDMLGLVSSIALRPCTGALFVLVIALRMDIFAAGCLAVLAMGVGTASLNVAVAASGVAARRLALIPADPQRLVRLSALLHIAGGAMIVALSLNLA